MSLINSNPALTRAIDTGVSQSYNITSATVLKVGSGFVARVSVIVAGSAPGSVNDSATSAGVAVANQIGVIPNTVGFTQYSFPYNTGLVIVPGTGQTVAVSFI